MAVQALELVRLMTLPPTYRGATRSAIQLPESIGIRDISHVNKRFTLSINNHQTPEQAHDYLDAELVELADAVREINTTQSTGRRKGRLMHHHIEAGSEIVDCLVFLDVFLQNFGVETHTALTKAMARTDVPNRQEDVQRDRIRRHATLTSSIHTYTDAQHALAGIHKDHGIVRTAEQTTLTAREYSHTLRQEMVFYQQTCAEVARCGPSDYARVHTLHQELDEIRLRIETIGGDIALKLLEGANHYGIPVDQLLLRKINRNHTKYAPQQVQRYVARGMAPVDAIKATKATWNRLFDNAFYPDRLNYLSI